MSGHLPFNVSEAGIIEMTKTTALEPAPGIRANAICPGYVLTDMRHWEIVRCAAGLPLRGLAESGGMAVS